MSMGTLPRMRLKALSQGHNDGHGFAVPLAARFAARINECDSGGLRVRPDTARKRDA